jgi:hypothetical protein
MLDISRSLQRNTLSECRTTFREAFVTSASRRACPGKCAARRRIIFPSILLIFFPFFFLFFLFFPYVRVPSSVDALRSSRY